MLLTAFGAWRRSPKHAYVNGTEHRVRSPDTKSGPGTSAALRAPRLRHTVRIPSCTPIIPKVCSHRAGPQGAPAGVVNPRDRLAHRAVRHRPVHRPAACGRALRYAVRRAAWPWCRSQFSRSPPWSLQSSAMRNCTLRSGETIEYSLQLIRRAAELLAKSHLCLMTSSICRYRLNVGSTSGTSRNIRQTGPNKSVRRKFFHGDVTIRGPRLVMSSELTKGMVQ